MIVANAIAEEDVVTVRFTVGEYAGWIVNARVAHVGDDGFVQFLHGGRLYTIGLNAELYDLDF